MSTKKPSETEDEYFAKEEANRLHALAVEKQRATAAADAEALKKQHWMHCPKCGFDLDTISFRGIQIDRCFHCGGTWLDHGELEQLVGTGEPAGLLKALVSMFRRPPRATSDLP
jgi:Zn-finger nucleic acid-binding protein